MCTVPHSAPSIRASSPGQRAAQTPTVGSVDREAHYAQTQFALGIAAVVPFAVAVLIQWVADKGALHWLATFMLVLSGSACIGLRTYQAQLGRLVSWIGLALGLWLVLVALVVLAYIGPMSAGVIVFSPICYLYGASRPEWKAWALLLACTTGFLLLALLTATGAIDIGAAPIGMTSKRPTMAIVGLTVVTELVLIGAFAVSRHSRKLLLEALGRLERANRELRARDAQLERARDLENVVDHARVGRLTGTTVGRYQVGEVIGRGGMGEVYRAWSDAAERPVALKVLTPSMACNPVHVERFFREARVCSELESPHIVKVLDNGWAEEGYPYLAMELLRGRDLAAQLAELGRLDLAEVGNLVAQVASALEVAHDVGVVHRDMKPENVFCVFRPEGPRWVVLDFGVSKAKTGGGSLTQGGLIGTPRFMAPEQARAATVDCRSDVFSLGAIAYRCITGRLAFDADDPLGVLVQVMAEQPIDPLELVAIPPDVGLWLALALAKDPNRRIPTVRMLAATFQDAVRGCLAPHLRQVARDILTIDPWSDLEAAETLRPAQLSGAHRSLRAMRNPELARTSPLPETALLPPLRSPLESITTLAATAPGIPGS
jgi:serine/threonine protein kinase